MSGQLNSKYPLSLVREKSHVGEATAYIFSNYDRYDSASYMVVGIKKIIS